jgi:hypothetical protein
MDDDNLLKKKKNSSFLKCYRIFFDFFCFFIEIWFDVSKKERSEKMLIYKGKKRQKNKSKPQIDIKKTNRQIDIHTYRK